MTFSIMDLFVNNDIDIQQGQHYKEVNRIYSDSGKIHVAPLQLTSAPYLSSISEAMQGNDSTLSSSNATITINSSTNEEEFNKTLVEYTTLYNTFSEDFVKKNSLPGAPANIDPAVLQHLMMINNKLIYLADKINKEIMDLKVTDDSLKNKINDQRMRLATYIRQFREQQSKMGNMQNVNVDGLQENSNLVLISNKYHYLVWFILGLTIIAIVIYTFTNNNISNSIVLIVSLFSIYFLSLWINNEYIRYQ